jgi:hypothetical protein
MKEHEIFDKKTVPTLGEYQLDKWAGTAIGHRGM